MQVTTQDFQTKNIRASLILTNSYVAGTVIDGPTGTGAHLMNQLVILVNFTKGSLTTGEVIVEFSNDQSSWYQESSEAVSSGIATVSPLIHTFGATGLYRLMLNIKDKYIRISAHGTGTVTNSLMSIVANYGVI